MTSKAPVLLKAQGPPKVPIPPKGPKSLKEPVLLKGPTLLKVPAAPKTPFPPPLRGKEALTADLTAILASRPENKKWQTVPARRKDKSRTVKHKKLASLKKSNKETHRIFLQRVRENISKAEDADIILAVNHVLIQENLLDFV